MDNLIYGEEPTSRHVLAKSAPAPPLPLRPQMSSGPQHSHTNKKTTGQDYYYLKPVLVMGAEGQWGRWGRQLPHTPQQPSQKE
jgi:hypothetical protein